MRSSPGWPPQPFPRRSGSVASARSSMTQPFLTVRCVRTPRVELVSTQEGEVGWRDGGRSEDHPIFQILLLLKCLVTHQPAALKME